MQIDGIMVVGTSHISKESVNEIKQAITSFKPDIVAVELDIKRYSALLSKKKHRIRISDIFRIGISGYFFAILGRFVQQKLGKIVNMEPGSDMMAAIKLAKQNKLEIALIDQDIQITLKRFSQYFSWKERFNFLFDILRSVFSPHREMKRLGIHNLDLTKVPSKKIIKSLMEIMRKDYPNVYRVLLTERNEYMAKSINQIKKNNPDKKILVVVGAAHHEGLNELLKDSNHVQYTYSFNLKTS